MPVVYRQITGILAVLLTLAVGGCGASSERIPISGTVKYKGQPLTTGMITFSPKDSSKGTIEGAAIADGRYGFPSDKGLLPGAYKVAITASDASAAQVATDTPPGAPRRFKEILPERYNKKSTLNVEVSPTGKRTFDFDLD